MKKCGMVMIKTNWEKANSDEEKNSYSGIIPSGFVQKQYDSKIVPGGYLYHRCHLIGWNIGGIDVDKRNLMTGTRDFNIKGMRTFENKVYKYLKANQTNNVLYRVTPYFDGDNKLAKRSKC